MMLNSLSITARHARLPHRTRPRAAISTTMEGHPPDQPPPPPSGLAFVSAAELRARLAAADEHKGAPQKKTIVLDVRDADERAAAIAGAINVPAHRLRGEGTAADAELDAVIECVEEEGACVPGGRRDRKGALFKIKLTRAAPLPTSCRSATAAGATEIVVHCALSQVRGPACARRLNERLAAQAAEGGEGVASSSSRVRIAVLTGGFDGWHAIYGDDAAVTTDPGV